MSDNWYKLDNVAKVFLATHNKRDTRSIRVSCNLKDKVMPEILQQALINTVRIRPQFQVRIRRGFFWHYIEQTDVMPVVVPEKGRPCPVLYGNEYKGTLHYQVSYFENRINIDMFHAISDGTGALNFLKLLVLEYLRILYPEEMNDVSVAENASVDDRDQNSYEHFYDSTEGHIPKKILNKKKKAYQIQNRKLPYNQLQFFEVYLETDKIKQAGKEMGVSVTSFLGAHLMIAIKDGMPFSFRHKPITISLPVNLRNYYPSKTLRNFFNSVDVSHTFTGDETIESLAHDFDEMLKNNITPERIHEQMNRYQSIERLAVARMVPLPFKQPVVKAFSKKEGKTVTAVLSNLGPVKIPPKMAKYVAGFTDYCSTEKLFITVTSYENDLVLGIASAYAGTGVLKRFIRSLNETGTSVRLYASEVVK